MGHFSLRFSSHIDAVLTDCTLVTLDRQRRLGPVRAMWDTGSSVTIISRHIAGELQLEPFQRGGMVGIGGETEGNTYLLHLLLPSGDAVTYQEVYEADLTDCDVIIGLDIITRGNFRLDSVGGETTFSFTIPNT